MKKINSRETSFIRLILKTIPYKERPLLPFSSTNHHHLLFISSSPPSQLYLTLFTRIHFHRRLAQKKHRAGMCVAAVAIEGTDMGLAGILMRMRMMMMQFNVRVENESGSKEGGRKKREKDWSWSEMLFRWWWVKGSLHSLVCLSSPSSSCLLPNFIA